VAVLPFTDLGADPEYRYFSDGITEDVLAHLTKLKDLKVTSRTSVMRYRNTTKPLREVAEELGVATVLEGSVRAVGGRVRVVAQLIDADTDTHLWADTYDRKMQDVFAVQSEVAEAVARALETELSREELEEIHEPPTENVAAYALVLEGMAALNTFQPDTYARAMDLFEGALRIDPDYARAHAGLALLLSFHPVVVLVPPPRYNERLKNAVDRALELDPSSSDAWLARGFYLWSCRRDWLEAERAMVRASELEPENPVVLLMQAYWDYMLGRFDEALTCFQRLEAADQCPPIAEVWWGLLDSYKAAYGELDFEIPMGRMDALAEAEPELAVVHVHRSVTLLWAGRLGEALESVERGLRLAPEAPLGHGLRGAMLARLGRAEEARAEDDWFRNAEEPESADRFSWAIIWLNSENRERGFGLLEEEVESHGSFLLPFLRLVPTYQHLWDHPRFRSVVEAIWPGEQKRVLGPYGWRPGGTDD
jgi:TolB-like protein/Tfp pilus assembly protein PilF